jgi:hypothetical protein
MKRLLFLALVLGFVISLEDNGFARDDGRPHQGKILTTVVADGQRGARASGSLTTIFASNNGFAGNTFDIDPATDLKITGIDVNVSPAGLTTEVDVYYKSGTCVGYESNSGAWTLLASGSGTAAGTDLPTFIDLPGAPGVSFNSGQTYGLYVDVSSYPTPILNYTNGGPTTYSNADLSLTTNSGQASPAFTAFFPSREWNGTLYYETGSVPPSCDIKCNGKDSDVTVYDGTNCKIDFSVVANDGAGDPVDIWVGLRHPALGWFTYDGNGPCMGWNIGLSSAYFTGPLVNMGDTCLDFPLGLGSYKAGIGIDNTANGNFNWPLDPIDMVNFDVVPPPPVYSHDDGSTENLLCWTNGGEICWFSRFTAYAGGETIVDMHCLFGSVMYPNYAPGNGTVTDCYVWDDPTNDGDPSDAYLVSTESITVQQVDTDIYNVYPLSNPATISGEFFVGCNMPHSASQYCAPIDNDTPYVSGDSFYCGGSNLPFDPYSLMANEYTPAEWGNYFCIRAGY